MTETPGYYGDPDDLVWLGSGQRPDAADLSDARAGVGRLTPLPIKLGAANQGVPLGDQALVVSNAPVMLAVPADALSATLQVSGAAVRWTVTGTAPAAAVGFRADPGAFITLTMPEALRAAQFIREGAVDAALFITYWS